MKNTKNSKNVVLRCFCSGPHPLSQKQRDPEQRRLRMTRNWSVGFTLAELLVVVLIIGILSAIALPQFQTAMDKSRYATLMPLAKTVSNAQEAYYMNTGNYSPDLAYLDVQLPGSTAGTQANLGDGATVEISEDEKYDYVKISKDNLENNYVIYQNQTGNFPSEIHCEALKGSSRAERLCKTLGGEPKSGSLTPGYDTYILEGTGAGKFPPAFIQNWKMAGIPQETIDKMVDAMTLLKEIAQARERYYQKHGTYPSNFDQLDIDVPQNIRAGGWNGSSSQYPDQYMFSCTIQSDHSSSCIANAYNTNLPMFQFTYTTYAACVMYGAKNNTLNNKICSSLPGSISHGYYYTIADTLEEL